MSRRPPSIRSLEAFEAVARLQSVSRAAEELCITQAAVSIRLKGLEEHLGFLLFVRENGQFRLSAAGARYLMTVREVIGRLTEAADWAQRPVTAVRLTVFNAFAQHWLIPRFDRLMTALGEIEVALIVHDESDPAAHHDTDLSIRLADREEPGMVRLVDDELIAVCRPDFQTKFRLFHPQDLLRVKLLHEGGQEALHAGRSDPGNWLRKAGIDAGGLSHAIGFRNASLLVDAALHRIGVALVRHSLVVDEIAEGRLVMPFSHAVPCGQAIYLAGAPMIERDAHVARLRNWLIAEAASTSAIMAPVALRQPA
ncbi:MAG TPA: LysR family transcriptional regulator [Aliidongia sp.]|uniref:LysR family transcriptional regulator n=1 Tax=Aliidongia sp. TaxID=1914230 RepID=UPI002DDC9B78|nr:LysR family transcriptional regulator [Aliidongia sp.]HEV2673658.1 LysR family transcriptional regulator [Aliidongia sp.]